MKFTPLVVLLQLSLTIHSQESFNDIFFDSQSEESVFIDTISNPNCIWQIGAPQKSVFVSAVSVPNAIVTDTINPIPANDTSVFYIKHHRDNSAPSHIFGLQFSFQLDGDSTDFGMIEISPDTGNTWINVLTDTVYGISSFNSPNTFSGSTNGVQQVYFDFTDWASNYSPTFPVNMTADTILFRFTYISDSINSPRDGWLIDNITLSDWWEGIEEETNSLFNIYPTIASNYLNIEFIDFSMNNTIEIYNELGQKVFAKSNFDNKLLDLKYYPNGIYFLKFSKQGRFDVKKFIIKH